MLGLDYIHNFAKIAHKNIMPKNLFISANNQLKLSNFGITAMFSFDRDS